MADLGYLVRGYIHLYYSLAIDGIPCSCCCVDRKQREPIYVFVFSLNTPIL